MQKWEYLSLDVGASSTQKEFTCTVNGKLYTYPYPEPPRPDSDWYSRVLNHFGDEGWELVGFRSESWDYGHCTSYLFKRPKE